MIEPDSPKFKIDETIFLPTHMAIPARTKSRLIIPLDTIHYRYNFKDYDRKTLLKYVEDKELSFTLFLMQSDRRLNPCTNRILGFRAMLSVLSLAIYLVFLYLSLGFVIISLFNPVIILLSLFLQAKFVKKLSGIRLLLIQGWKLRDLRGFLRRENDRYYSLRMIEWSLGDKGNWVQIDIKKGLLSNRKERRVSPSPSPNRKKA